MDNITLYDKMNDLIEYIESNLLYIESIDECIEKISFSKYHILHVFKQLTDTTIMSYITKRRLTESLNDLNNTEQRIIDIAMKYGFAHEQSYGRAFKKQFHVTPSQYRKNPNSKEITLPTSIKQFFQTNEGILITPKYIHLPEMMFIGEKGYIKGNESYVHNTAKNRGFDFFYSRSSQITNAITPDVYYGITWHEQNDFNNSFYMPSLEVDSINTIPKGMDFKVIPAADYAVFTYIGDHSIADLTLKHFIHIHEFTERIFHDAYLIYDNPFFFERIDTTNATDNYVEVELWFRLC